MGDDKLLDALAIAAREGRLHRNFQGYTSDAARTLIGIGATSIGRTPQGYVQNANTAQITVRAKGNDLSIQTFPLSEAAAAKRKAEATARTTIFIVPSSSG